MGVIFLACKTEVKIIAVGGCIKMFMYFKKALDELHTLAVLLGAELHFCFLDREAYAAFRADDKAFIAANILPKKAITK